MRIFGAVACILLIPALAAKAEVPNLLLDLRGSWKFEIGDNPQWANPRFEDRKWTEISVPSAWEDEGFPGYDGYAWYRKHFQTPADIKDQALYLDLGIIDDVDEVFLNGHFLGFSGVFPPDYITAFDVFRHYRLPVEYLNPSGENVIAVRIFDNGVSGGILRGRIGIFSDPDPLKPELPITSIWRFSTGDDIRWKNPGFDDSRWQEIEVPAYWETQGFKGYDGLAWYRVKLHVPASLRDQKLILLLGKIDDVDEAFVNGTRIGGTGVVPPREAPPALGNEYLQLRAYTIPPDLLSGSGDIVIAVRVCDVFIHGGIFDGPIGLIRREQYLDWAKRHRDLTKSLDKLGKNFLQKLLELFAR